MRKLQLKTMPIVIMFLVGMAATSPAQVTHYVCPTNPSAAEPYASWDSAATNIADAVSVANANDSGDTVLISNGVYHLTGTVLIGNTIVRGAAGDRAAVIVNGQGNVRCFNLNHEGAVLADLTVTNGMATQSPKNGGGVYVASGTVSNCVITKSQAPSSGGGIYLSDGLVTDCLITSNTADVYGGGCICWEPDRFYATA